MRDTLTDTPENRLWHHVCQFACTHSRNRICEKAGIGLTVLLRYERDGIADPEMRQRLAEATGYTSERT